VFDDARPERSYLVLARGADGRTRLTADEIEHLDLRGVRLVVLSACQTQRAVGGRAGGFAGLSGAMLAAGAGGVVGSLWRVDDALTRALMTEFHRAYRASPDGSAALRAAQLRLLQSPDPALRSPAAWAGFRYSGG
jgi:CHAT domain-containing protein